MAELILLWQDSQRSGAVLAAEEICRDCPDLLAEFERAREDLVRLDHFLESPTVVADSRFGYAAIHGMPEPTLPAVPGYEILEEIGRGGMGIVYKARQESLNRIVAIKTLSATRREDGSFVDRLRQEAKGLSRLSHPSIVQVFDIVETPSAIALILEYVAGETLSARLKRSPILPDEAARFAADLARTLSVVHGQGMLHRDVKPTNVLVTPSGEIKLADFGLVKQESGSVSELSAMGGGVLGTPSYMAPEQATGTTGDIGPSIDIYGVGATLYEMLTGRPPFVGTSPLDTVDRARTQEPVPPTLLNPRVPIDLETLCLKCLEKLPKNRPASARELAEEIDRFRHGIPILSRPVSSSERLRRWCSRRPAIASLIVVSIVATLTIGGLLALNNHNLMSFSARLTNLNRDLGRVNRELEVSVTTARQLQQTAEQREAQAQEALYAADIYRAGLALKQDDSRETAALLDRHSAERTPTTSHNFEWWYLHKQVSRRCRVLLDVGHPIYVLKWAPEGSVLAAAGRDAIVRLIDLRTNSVIQHVTTGQIEVNGIDFSPNGLEFATSGDDGTIRIWNRASGTERLNIPTGARKVFRLAYCRDGQQIISNNESPVLRVFDTATGNELAALKSHDGNVQNLVVTENGEFAISTGKEGKLVTWDLNSRSPLRQFELPGVVGPVEHLAQRKRLITGNRDGLLQVLDDSTGRILASANLSDQITALASHQSDNLLAVADATGQLHLYRLHPDKGLEARRVPSWNAHDGRVYAAVWTADGQQLITAGKDGRVVSWNRAGLMLEASHEFDIPSSPYFCLIPGTSLLAASSQGRLTCWDWKSRTLLSSGTARNVLLHSLVSGRGRCGFIVGSAQRKTDEVQFFTQPDPLANQPLDSLPLAVWKPQGELNELRIAPDGRTALVSRWFRAAADQEEEHLIWLLKLPGAEREHNADDASRSRDAVRENRPIREVSKADRIPLPFAREAIFSPDGNGLAVSCRVGLVYWDIAAGQPAWERPVSQIESMAFSPNGQLIATGGNDRQVRIHHTSDGSLHHRLANHRGRVRCVTFSPEGRLLATSDALGTVTLWHVATGQKLLTLPHPECDARHMEFSTNGHHLICQLRHSSGVQTDKIVVYDGSPVAQ